MGALMAEMDRATSLAVRAIPGFHLAAATNLVRQKSKISSRIAVRKARGAAAAAPLISACPSGPEGKAGPR